MLRTLYDLILGIQKVYENIILNSQLFISAEGEIAFNIILKVSAILISKC